MDLLAGELLLTVLVGAASLGAGFTGGGSAGPTAIDDGLGIVGVWTLTASFCVAAFDDNDDVSSAAMPLLFFL